MSPMSRLRLSHRATARVALVLAVALVLLQTVGALHRITHVASAGSGTHHAAVIGKSHADGAANGWLDRLFAGHSPNGHDCDAFDQASHGDLAGGFASLDVPAVAPAVVPVPAHAGWHIAAQARGFLARGPPPLA